MKRCIMICFIILFLAIVSISLYFHNEEIILKTNNTCFVESIYNESQLSNRCYLESIIPCDWDRVIVFDPYSSRSRKYKAAGYIYNYSIRTGESENVLSMVFLLGNSVVYYVDFDLNEYSIAPSNEDNIIYYHVYTKDHIRLIKNVQTLFRIAYRKEDPYIDISINDNNGQIDLILDKKHKTTPLMATSHRN